MISQDPMTEFRITVGAPTRCHVRTALTKAQKEFEGAHPEALLWGARLPEDQPPR